MQRVILKSVLLYTALLCLLLVIFNTSAASQQTTRGRDFYVAFLPNLHGSTLALDSVYIYVAAEQPTTGTISYNDGTTLINVPFTLTGAGHIFQYGVWWTQAEMKGLHNGSVWNTVPDNEQVTRRSFHIQASQDVSVYAMNQATTTADAALVYPTPALGSDYFVMSYKSDGRLVGGSPTLLYTPSEFCIVATVDSTKVVVMPSVSTSETGLNAKTIVLNKGDTWLCQAEFSSATVHDDLSGTRITSTAPIAVFGGHMRATVPIEKISILNSRDHLFEQLPPINVWGMNYIITPLARPTGSAIIPGVSDIYRVIAAQNGTAVYFNGLKVAALNRGQVFEAPLLGAGLLSASDRVLVSIVMQTHGDGSNNLYNGDPSMMIVPPRSQYLKKYTFVNTMVGGTYVDQYITVITAASNTGNLLLDGRQVAAQWTSIPSTCYVYSNIKVSGGTHTLESPVLVGLFVYGHGPALSYGYVGGMAFVPDLGNDEVTAGPDQDVCIGDSVTIKMSGRILSAQWSCITPGQKVPCLNCPQFSLVPTQNVSYVLSAMDSLGCTIIDTINVVVNQIPDVNILPSPRVCTDVPLQLRASGHFQQATWTPSTGLSCTNCPNPVATPGKDIRYYVTVRNGNSPRCSVTDSIDIHYQPGIAGRLPARDTICKGDSSFMSLKYGGTLRWNPLTNVSCATCDSVWLKPQQTTTYTLQGDSAGCTTQAQVTVVVLQGPTLQIPHDITVCKGQSAVINAVSNGSSFSWSPSRYLSSTTAAQVTVQPDSDIVYVLRVESGLNKCPTVDSVRVHVRLAPSIQLAVQDTTICARSPLQLHAVVQDADSIAWEPPVGLSCNNCADPVITTATDQTYTLKAMLGGACSLAKTINVHVLPSPTLQLSSNSTVCAGDSVTLNAQSSDSVHWEANPTLSCVDCPDPVVLTSSAGSLVLRATARSANGCVVSDSVVIKVLRSPTDQLIVDDDTICMNSQPTHARFVGGVPGSTYAWDAAQGLSCTDCAEAELQPAQSTVYHVRVTSPDGCERRFDIPLSVIPCTHQIRVLNADAGSVSACDAKQSFLTLQCVSDADIQVDSIYEMASQGLHFRLDTSVHLPLAIAAHGSVKVPIIVQATRSGAVSATAGVRSNATADLRDTTASLEITMDASVFSLHLLVHGVAFHAGSSLLMPVEMQSGVWPQTHVRAIDVRLRYRAETMYYMGVVQLGKEYSDDGWTIQADPELADGAFRTVLFHLRGDTALAANSIVFSPRFQTLLSTDSSFHADVDSVAFPDDALCMRATSTSQDNIPDGCLYNLRAVQSSGIPFALQSINPNPVQSSTIEYQYSLAYECAVQLRIFDALGRVQRVLVQSQQSAGTYSIRDDATDLSDGSYYCQLQAGGVTMVQRFVVQR